VIWDKRSTNKIVKTTDSINLLKLITIRKHLYEKDNFTDKAPAPIGPYNQAVLKGTHLCLGQIALNPLRES
jgi:enamine deaminase RidA (YjgF/YER057c/UK114 family)